MNDDALQSSESQDTTQQETTWRGVDFSGLTVVLGVGTGRLIEILNQHANASSGSLVVVERAVQRLSTLLPLQSTGPLTPIRGRSRHIPVLSDTVDLLVVNGVLREVPDDRLPAFFAEIFRALVPGGRLRVTDILEPPDEEKTAAWLERNRIVRRLSETLMRPVAIAANLQATARILRALEFEQLSVALLPGYALNDEWLEDTVNAIRNMAGRVADRPTRDAILQGDIPRLIAAYARGNQTAAQRFVLQGNKAGDLALNMDAGFTEEDLIGPED